MGKVQYSCDLATTTVTFLFVDDSMNKLSKSVVIELNKELLYLNHKIYGRLVVSSSLARNEAHRWEARKAQSLRQAPIRHPFTQTLSKLQNLFA